MAAIVTRDTPCAVCGEIYWEHIEQPAPGGCRCFIPPEDCPRDDPRPPPMDAQLSTLGRWKNKKRASACAEK